MWSDLRGFVWRHRRKLVFAGGLVGASWGIWKLAKKLREIEEREARSLLDRARLACQAGSTERTCDQTARSLGARLGAEVERVLGTELMLASIKAASKDRRVGLWEEMKVLVLAKHVSLLYCGLMLSAAMRVQLNIMAGTSARDVDNKTPLSLQERYLSLVQHFLGAGCGEVCRVVERHVRSATAHLHLKARLSLHDVEHLFLGIQAGISDDPRDPLANLTTYLFEEVAEGSDLSPLYRHTAAILGRDEVRTACESCLARAFTNSLDWLAQHPYASHPGGETESKGWEHPGEVGVPLAKLLPALRSLSEVKGRGGDSDAWIQQFSDMDKMRILGEDVFNSFSGSRIS